MGKGGRRPMRKKSPNRVAVRAAVGFALVSAITALSILASAVLSFRAADRREQILTRYADDLVSATGVQTAAERMVAAARGYLLTDTPSVLSRVTEARATLDAALDALDREVATPGEHELQRSVRQSAIRYEERLDALIRTTSATEAHLALARVVRDDMLPAREELDAAVERLVAHKRRLHTEARERTAEMAQRTVRATAWLGVLSLSASVLLAWRFTARLAATYRLERESSVRAAQALAGKDEILRIVAHDLRSPLTSISLRASSLAQLHRMDPSVEKPATAIRGTCDRMADLIDGLVQAASVEAGRLSIHVSPCSVAELVAVVVDTFGPAARRSGIEIDARVEPRELQVLADRGRLIQVLSNLVGNALKFTPDGGRVQVSAFGRARGATFEVSDTGRGIASEDIAHVFERFWKRDAASARGAGLGLYIAKGIVEAHGGQMTVDSQPGHGSTFRFELPLAHLGSKPPSAPSAGAAAHVTS